MNSFLSKCFILCVVAGFFACEDKVDLELEEAEPKLVVDAWLDKQGGDQIITLSYSQPLNNTDEPTFINDAEVSLIESDVIYPTEAIGKGQYRLTSSDFGAVGSSYELNIILADGKRYISETDITPVPIIDSIVTEFRENEVFGPDGYYAEFFARDLPGHGNTYWIKTFKNGAFLNDPFEINIAYDAAFDAGGMVDNFVFITPIRELVNPVLSDDEIENEIAPYAVGDKIRVEIHSISLEAFDFMEVARDQLQNGSNGIFASPIANTVGNVRSIDTDETVLGIFNIADVSSLETTVVE